MRNGQGDSKEFNSAKQKNKNNKLEKNFSS